MRPSPLLSTPQTTFGFTWTKYLSSLPFPCRSQPAFGFTRTMYLSLSPYPCTYNQAFGTARACFFAACKSGPASSSVPDGRFVRPLPGAQDIFTLSHIFHTALRRALATRYWIKNLGGLLSSPYTISMSLHGVLFLHTNRIFLFESEPAHISSVLFSLNGCSIRSAPSLQFVPVIAVHPLVSLAHVVRVVSFLGALDDGYAPLLIEVLLFRFVARERAGAVPQELTYPRPLPEERSADGRFVRPLPGAWEVLFPVHYPHYRHIGTDFVTFQENIFS